MSDPCRVWLDAVRGRVLKNGITGSAVAWSRRTDDGLALVASATHTLGEGWFGPTATTIATALALPEQQGTLRLYVPPADGSPSLTELSPLYSLFHLGIPAPENTAMLRTVRPRHDAFIGLTDRTRITYDDGPFPESPDRVAGLVPLYDPRDHTRTDPLIAQPAANDAVILVGHPQDTTMFPHGAFATGNVLSDADATAAIATLAAAGDEEGSIPYDAEAELLVVGDAVAGMSGGGAFALDGTWLGVMVRASDAQPAFGNLRIVRVVRATYLAAEVQHAYAALPVSQRISFAPYLDPVLE